MSESHVKPGDQLEKLHLQIQDMLAGYVDDELNAQDKALVEAHLAGCDACTADVARQHLLHEKLGATPAVHLSAHQHRNLDNALDDEMFLSNTVKTGNQTSWKMRISESLPGRLTKSHVAAISGWSLAILLLVFMMYPGQFRSSHVSIPMIQDVITEYQRVAQIQLPGTDSGDKLSAPVDWPQAKAVASWKTVIGGESAEVFAIRNANSIVLQVRVSDRVFFNNPTVRKALTVNGKYETRENDLKIVAMPLQHGGLLMVGPHSSFPSLKSISLKTF